MKLTDNELYILENKYTGGQTAQCAVIEIRELRAQVKQLIIKKAHQQAIIDCFSTTAEGYPAIPGSTLYLYSLPPSVGLHEIKIPKATHYCWYCTPQAATDAAAQKVATKKADKLNTECA